MVSSLKRIKVPMVGTLIVIILAAVLWTISKNGTAEFVMGGAVHESYTLEQEETTESAFNTDQTNGIDDERFQRPSKQAALKLKYAAKDFIDHSEKPPYIHVVFQQPEDVIQAYYAILKDASNMAGFYGGCGTIGWSKIPYPYAYELLNKESREKMPYEKFEQSFAGVGHMTLLKLIPAYQPPNTPENIKYYMVETEIITGPPYDAKNENKAEPGYFAYYYGLVTTEYDPAEGWKIKRLDYVPEDFLCHPMHHWDYDAQSLVGVVYKNWYRLIDTIEKIEQDDSLIHVYAAGGGNKYRFDFIRITNGDDVLLHEYMLQNDRWNEVNLLKERDQVYKFSVLNPNLTVK